MLKIMRRLRWNRLAMPSAMHKRMQRTPVLHRYRQLRVLKGRIVSIGMKEFR